MKGIIFNVLSEYVEEKHGLEVWDHLLTDTNLNGIYTSAGNYPDEQLFALVTRACEMLQADLEVVLLDFGRYALRAFKGRYPIFFEAHTCRSFLLSVDAVIHREVLKLYPGADLPSLRYEEPEDGSLHIIYQSHRNLPPLAQGLILGATDVFKENIRIEAHQEGTATRFILHFSTTP